MGLYGALHNGAEKRNSSRNRNAKSHTASQRFASSASIFAKGWRPLAGGEWISGAESSCRELEVVVLRERLDQNSYQRACIAETRQKNSIRLLPHRKYLH
jgi:hypothetical protein